MADTPLDIGSYLTHEGQECPRVFFAHGEKITVMNVQRIWMEAEGSRRFFTVEGSDKFIHTLYRDIPTGNWFYRGFEPNRSIKR